MIAEIRSALYLFIEILQVLILIRCVLSFVRVRDNVLVTWVYKITDPILLPIQNMIYKNSYGVGIDISPLVALLLLNVISRLLGIIL